MTSVAHIINLFQPSETSDLKLAQEVTVASMIMARNACSQSDAIELLSAQTKDDRKMVPSEFRATADLDRDVTDIHPFEKKMHLPLLFDILNRAYCESEADYIIYSNVDIGVQPHFYDAVLEFIEQGFDAFMINRRRIPAKFHSVEEMELMFSEKGMKHPGFDCFVFKRELFPKFSLENVCIGVPYVEMTLSQNLFCFAENPKVFTDEFLTFHIGMEIFKRRAPKEYLAYNGNQFWHAIKKIENDLDSSKWTYGQLWFPFRMVYWGLHPCFPIRLALKLEARRWKFS